MPRLAFGPDPLFNNVSEEELYQTYKPKSLPASGWGGTPEAAMAIGQNFLEGLSRGRAQSRAEADRKKASTLNALRVQRDSLATDKGVADEAERGRLLAELDAKIADVGLQPIEKPGLTEEPHGALGHVGRFFSNAATRIAGHSGQAPSLGTVAEGDQQVPWMEHFNQEAAGLKRVPTTEEAANLAAEGVRESYAEAKAANDPNVGNYFLRNAKIIRSLPHLSPAYQQMLAGRAPMDPSASIGDKITGQVYDAAKTPVGQRTDEQQGTLHAGNVLGVGKAESQTVSVGHNRPDGRTEYRAAEMGLDGKLRDAVTKEPLSSEWMAAAPGSMFTHALAPTEKGIAQFNPGTGFIAQTGEKNYADPNAALHYRAMANATGWQMHNLQNQEAAKNFLAEVRAYTNGNPATMNAEINRRVELGMVNPMLAEMAREIWGAQEFTQARTGAAAAGGELNQQKAAQTEAVTGFFTPPGREKQPQTQPDHRPASVSGGAAEYGNLIGGHAQQYAAPGVPVSPRTGTPIAAPQSAPSDAVAAYQKFLSGFRARGTSPSDIYGSHIGAASAGSTPAAAYLSLY